MKTTKVYCVTNGNGDGAPFIPTDKPLMSADRPARLVWESDWRKHQRAMKLVRWIAKNKLQDCAGEHSVTASETAVREAIKIAGKDGAK